MSLIFDPEVSPQDFRGRRVRVMRPGKGRATAGIARFAVANGAQVTLADPKPRAELDEGIARLGDTPAELVLGPSSDDAALGDPDFVFINQGVRPRSATVQRALQRKIPVLTEMGLFFRLCPAPIVGVTGTKGKSTTYTLITRILEHGPRRAVSGANTGTSIIDRLPPTPARDTASPEPSSFHSAPPGRDRHVPSSRNCSQ